MADWLLLRLPRAAEPDAQWLLVDAQGLALSSQETGALTEAAALAAGRRVCVLVNSADVLLADIDLPVKGGARALQVAPFALEEQLAGELEAQHFAIGRRDESSGRTQVAVVARSQMAAWLETLRAAGLVPDLLCTESALLPRNPSQAVALLDQDTLSVLPAGSAALPRCLPAGPLADTLEIALDGAPLAGIDLLLTVTTEAWQSRAIEVETLRPRLGGLAVQLLKAGLLPWLAPQLASAAPLNLLQGEHQPRRDQQHHWRRWQLAAVLALALLLLHVAGQGYTLWQLRRAETQVDASLDTLAAQLLPGDAAGRTDLRLRIQQRLRSPGGGSALLGTLQALAGSVGSATGSSLQALSFRDSGTELKLQARDAAGLEHVNEALRKAGWQAELVAGAAAANGYEGRIQIKSAGGKP
jgi:general secretion pathway protein L